ncbi:hypothetical protein R9C00_06795 [Flammeovirgaceae bacterium SG7u.111]|nr:hypothetical protein [Flammeovirgaceae bacterium SG7u.132]WPO37150.1 hypothetical protein R9C00_06795 [Flammeovirgaceae bacterium SG7u.111]
MKSIEEIDLINFVHVYIDHDHEDETQLMVSAQIFVEPIENKTLKLKFIDNGIDAKQVWNCDFDIDDHEENDSSVVGFQEVIINTHVYLMFVFRKNLPKVGQNWCQFFPQLYIDGQRVKGHDGTIHKPAGGDGD